MQETQETPVPSLGGEDPLEEIMATHSSILAWRIPWTEEPGRLQPMWLQESNTTEHTHIHTHACTCTHTRAHTQSWTCFFFFFNWSKLLYSVMLVSAVQKRESAVCIYVSPASWASLPSPAPSTPLGHHGTRNTLCAGQRLPSSCLSYTWWCVYISVTLPARPALLSPPCPMSDMLLVNFLVSKYRSQEAAVNTEERI